ncbi:MAG: metallopeptidase TldD-related protein [Candidatus Riflebacteria bacterium]
MEKLLEKAIRLFDQVEIFSHESEVKSVNFENLQLHDIETSLERGVSVRAIKNGKLGFAYTRNLIDPDELLQNAMDSLHAGVSADFSFPATGETAYLPTFDQSLEDVSSSRLVDECQRICDCLNESGGEVSASAGTGIKRIRLMNSAGTDLRMASGTSHVFGRLGFPGTGSTIGRVIESRAFAAMDDAVVKDIFSTFTASRNEIKIRGGRMKVLFMPNSMYSLIWRINAAANARNIFEKTSPLTSRLGEKVFSEKLTIYDDPHDDCGCSARSFDDEGVATKKLCLFDRGVFKNFFSDLKYSEKLKVESTGHGYRVAQWQSDPLPLNPVPATMNLRFAPGEKTVAELVRSIDRGVIVEVCLGAHSGNIINGDLSIGGCPAMYVENGEIKGRASDIMVAGNIYDMFKNVIDLSAESQFGYGSYSPAMLIDDMNVSSSG